MSHARLETCQIDMVTIRIRSRVNGPERGPILTIFLSIHSTFCTCTRVSNFKEVHEDTTELIVTQISASLLLARLVLTVPKKVSNF